MTTNVYLRQLVQSKRWYELVENFTQQELIRLISFRDGLRVAYHLLFTWEDPLQSYALEIFETLRQTCCIEWNESWQYDALLGLAYYITCEHEKRYEAYKRAFDKAKNPPPRLLIEMARCADCPGTPPISYAEAIHLVKKALQKGPFVDGFGLLRSLYGLQKDSEQESYWATILKQYWENPSSPSIVPEFLEKEYYHCYHKEEGSLEVPSLEKSSIFYEDDATTEP
jgi:hypothetical protein